jgi:AcrR family transcriptional regulator
MKDKAEQNTKEKLRLAFEKLLMKKTIEKISVNELSKEIGIHRITFYYHFADKYDLLYYMFKKELMTLVEESESESILGTVIELFRYLVNHEKAYKNAFASDDYQSLKHLYFEATKVFFDNLIDRMTEHENFKVSRKSIINFFSNASTVYIINWLNDPERTDYKIAATELVHMIEFGFLGCLNMNNEE